MKRTAIKMVLIFFITASFTKPATVFAQVNVQDSLALVDLYNSTDGSNWAHSWDLSSQADRWYGIQVIDNRVTSLELTNNRLKGNIPSTLGNLSGLQVLDLTLNNELTGTIPATLGNLSNLQNLRLNENQLTGDIPATLGNLKKLEQLDLYLNQLTGSIPSSLGNIDNLKSLILNDNQLSGNIPSSLGKLKNLTSLDVEHNQLSGNIPSSLGQLSNLGVLILGHNQLTGSIPSSIGNLTVLHWLIANSNKLSGSIPASLGNLSNLTVIALFANQLSGKVPASWADIKTLNGLNLDSNRFTFDGIEDIALKATIQYFYYSPQANIPLHYIDGKLSVSAGGTLVNNTYHWYKDAILYKEITGDSALPVTEAGNYSVAVTNNIATDLTLYSDTLNTTPLPVDLLSFTGQQQGKHVLLQWQTANELNMQGYNVERSANGKDYSGIDNINAKGKGVLPNTYSIIDALPSDGTNYYRLKMINLDGSFAYSNVIKINADEVITELKLYPNPVHDILNIDFATTNSGNITLKISDASGKVIQQKFIHSNGNTLSTSFNIQNLASGVYYVTVEQNGKKQKKIFVVR